MIFLLIYLASALICKKCITYAFKNNPEKKIDFIQSVSNTSIDADKMINIICLAPLVNTGIILVWVWLILDQIFSGK